MREGRKEGNSGEVLHPIETLSMYLDFIHKAKLPISFIIITIIIIIMFISCFANR